MALSKLTKRLLLGIPLVLVALIVIVVLVVVSQLDRVVKMGVEMGGSTALGVKTQLSSASVSVVRGKLELQGLDVANPPGFTSPTFLKAGVIRVDVSLPELIKKEAHVQEITLEGPEFTYELKDGQTNVSVLMERLQKAESAPPPEPSGEPKQEGEPVKLKVDLLRVADAKVHVVIGGRTVNISIPEIEIRDIADKDGNAVPPSQIMSVMLQKITGNIEGSVAGTLGQGKEALQEGIDKAGEVGKDLGDQAGKATEGLKKLFGK